MASATVSAFLFWIDVTTAYFVKASVMHKTNFVLLSAVNIGLNKSAWILQLGLSGIGSGCSGVGLIVVLFLCWQVRQVWTCILTSLNNPGQKYDGRDFHVGFQVCVVAAKDAVVGIAEGLFLILPG